MIAADGRTVWLRDLVNVQAEPDGAICLRGVMIDVTARKQVEEALLRSEAYLSEAQRLTHTGSWAYNPVTRKTVYWSEEMFRIFGLDPRQGPPDDSTIRLLVAPEDGRRMAQALEKASREKTDFEKDQRLILPDGTIKHLHAIGHPVLNAAGEFVEFVGTAVDVTERKEAEEAIRKSRQLLQDIIDNSSALIYVKDLEGRFLLINHPLDKLLRTTALSSIRNTAEPILGKSDHDLFPKQQADAYRIFDQQVLAAGRVLQTEDTVPQKDGLHTYISIKAPLRDEQGKPYAVCGISTDITERKQLEEQLRELAQRLINAQEEERARIARELHDDIGQQITALSLSVDHLRRRISSLQREAREQAGRIHDQVSTLASAIRNLSHDLHPTILGLVGLAAALRVHCGEFSSQGNVSVSFEASDNFDDLPSAAALCLYRVVQETLQNVARHSRATHAEVHLTRSDGFVVLTVSDPGVGFDISQPRTSTGLGLVSIRERVRLVNGSLVVESAPNRGTTVRVEIPIPDHAEWDRPTPPVLRAS